MCRALVSVSNFHGFSHALDVNTGLSLKGSENCSCKLMEHVKILGLCVAITPAYLQGEVLIHL
jgi:hypothetical protein